MRSFHGAGKIQASTLPADMRLQRMLGHLPALVHKKPESVLVVACGAGITAGTFVLHPDVKRIVICDIEPLVPTVVTPMFGEENYHVVDGIARENPHTVNGKQVEVVYDDGRHFLRTTREKFDIITSDPIDPWVKGCAALNTVEYYRMCRDHLNPGGIVCLWIPLYESNLETTKSVIATFFQVFPHGILWSNEREGYGYDAILFGQVEPTVIDVDELQRRLDRPDHQLVKQSLREVGFGELERRRRWGGTEEGIDLLATYAGQAPLLKEWSRGAQINTDRNLRLQYLAGMWLNSNMGERILSGILAHYRFPDQTFVGSPERIDVLKEALRMRVERPPAGRPGIRKARSPDGPSDSGMACDRSRGRCRGRRGRGEERGPAIGTPMTEGQAAGFGRPGADADLRGSVSIPRWRVSMPRGAQHSRHRGSRWLPPRPGRRPACPVQRASETRDRSSGQASGVGRVRSGASAPRTSGRVHSRPGPAPARRVAGTRRWRVRRPAPRGRAAQALDRPTVDGDCLGEPPAIALEPRESYWAWTTKNRKSALSGSASASSVNSFSASWYSGPARSRSRRRWKTCPRSFSAVARWVLVSWSAG